MHIRPCFRTATGTSSSTVETTSPATICSQVPRLCSSGAPPPTRTTSGHLLQAMSPFPQPQSNCLYATEKTTTHTMERANRGRDMRQKNTSSRPPKTSRMQATSRIDGLDNQPSSAVGGLTKRATPGPALLAACIISQPLEANHSPVLVRNQQFDPPPTLTTPRCSPSPSRKHRPSCRPPWPRDHPAGSSSSASRLAPSPRPHPAGSSSPWSQ